MMKNKRIEIMKFVSIVLTYLSISVDCGAQSNSFDIYENKEIEVAEKWSVERAANWGAQQPWIVGVNFVPSDASNQLDMWQSSTWNPNLIDKELGWAEELGFNAVRVYLHYFPYRDDKDGFLDRIDKFLSITSKHSIKPIFVFFDDVWDPFPKSGNQKKPIKHLHNANWVQCPGREILWSPIRHKELKPYVTDILNRFKDDNRILFWDLYNEPQNTNDHSYGEHGTGKEEFSMLLLKEVFLWAREVNPSQPITSAPWVGEWVDETKMTEFNKFMLDNSDIITFHNYNDIDDFKRVSGPLKRYNRPIICTEYMSRSNNSQFVTHLPYMAKNNIGSISWGLVSGRTQTIYPWDSWDREYTEEPDLWFHDIFRKDGTPYKLSETELIKELTLKYNSNK